VSFRSSRHISELNLYAVDGSRAKPVAGPSLFRQVTSGDLAESDDLRQSYAEFEWRGPDRFVRRNIALFATMNSGLLAKLGSYGKLIEKHNDRRLIVEFSAEADCQLALDARYRVVGLRLGKFGD